jgi:hypothetical protein
MYVFLSGVEPDRRIFLRVLRGEKQIRVYPRASAAKRSSIHSILETPLSSAASRPGERFSVRTTEPVTLEGRALIPTGTRISGVVTSVTPPKAGLVKASIHLAFTGIEIGGTDYPFHTKASLDRSELIEKGAEFGGEEAAKGAIGMAVPPLEAVFLADDALKAARYYDENKNVTLPRGTKINVRVTAPVYIPLR